MTRTRTSYAGFLPPFAALCALGAAMGRWLWGRWFSVGGEALHGYLFFAILLGFVAYAAKHREDADFSAEPAELVMAAVFLATGILAFRAVPRLAAAVLFMSALYWSMRSSMPREDKIRFAALWPMLLLSLPYEPSLQFLLGYPLRRLAAILAAAVLPGVSASGVALAGGSLEVYVDAPCAGVGMLSWTLTLAGGVSLIFGLDGFRSAIMLAAGLACAIVSNAFRAALLYAGYAGLAPFGFQRYESATGLFCFALSGILLASAARRMGKARADSGGFLAGTNIRRNFEPAALLLCVVSIAVFMAGRENPAADAGGGPVRWPTSWEGQALAPAQPDETAEFFTRDFPGEFMEFSSMNEADAEEGYFSETQVLMRFVRTATRKLHPAEDCFRGAGYRITPTPLRADRNGRRWSGFIAEKSGRPVAVRQCVISVPDGDLAAAETSDVSWPDVSSWYWDTARPGAEHSPVALAVTVVEKL